MNGEKQKGLTGALVSAPTALALLGLFFMPWLKLSCNPEALGAQNPFAAAQANPMMPELATGEIGHASGWDLAGGDFTTAGRYAELQRQQEQQLQQNPSAKDQDMPKSRPWAYLGLAVPILLLVVSVACVAGVVAPQGGGKLLLLLALAGAAVVVSAATVDYVDDAFDLAEEQIASGGVGVPAKARFAFQHGMEQAKDNAKKALPTTATLYLWASLGLYGVAAVCGFVTLSVPRPIPARSSTRAASSTFRHDPTPPAAPSPPPLSHAPPAIPSYAPPPAVAPPPPLSHAPPAIPSYAPPSAVAPPPLSHAPSPPPIAPPSPSQTHSPMPAQPPDDDLPCFGPDLLPLDPAQTGSGDPAET